MNITLNISNETIAIWLSNLFLEEAKDAQGAMENEKLFALGTIGEDAEQHTENANVCKEYSEMLFDLHKEIEKYWK